MRVHARESRFPKLPHCDYVSSLHHDQFVQMFGRKNVHKWKGTNTMMRKEYLFWIMISADEKWPVICSHDPLEN